MSKHTKQHNLHGEVGIFSHLTMKVCCDLERVIGPEIHPQIRREHCLTLFYVGFRRSWDSILAQKMGHEIVFC